GGALAHADDADVFGADDLDVQRGELELQRHRRHEPGAAAAQDNDLVHHACASSAGNITSVPCPGAGEWRRRSEVSGELQFLLGFATEEGAAAEVADGADQIIRVDRLGDVGGEA